MAQGTVDLRTHAANITSQGGENGIIAAILARIGVTNRFAIEFGGYDAKFLSNIYPLWAEQGFKGLLIEGDPGVHAKITRQIEELTRARSVSGSAAVLNRWVQPDGPDSLDAILASVAPPLPLGPVPSEPDVLSIDIDSYDHAVWEGLKNFRPRVVLVEHNATIPPPFKVIARRGGVPIGNSAAALVELGRAKGYTLVACTQFNCIFVRDADAHHFAHAGDLDAHFDWSWPIYVIHAFDGGLCYAGHPRAHYSMTQREIDSFAPGLGFHPPPSDFSGWLRHPKRRLRRLWRRITGA